MPGQEQVRGGWYESGLLVERGQGAEVGVKSWDVGVSNARYQEPGRAGALELAVSHGNVGRGLETGKVQDWLASAEVR